MDCIPSCENLPVSFEEDLADAEGALAEPSSTTTRHALRKRSSSSCSITRGPPPDGLVAYAFTTTNVDYFAAARIPEEIIVRLEPGDYPFVKARTVIDLTRPEPEQLSALVSARDFKFVVQLRDEHVKAIDAAVRASTRITGKLKKMILANYG
jgi:hypothetical protein